MMTWRMLLTFVLSLAALAATAVAEPPASLHDGTAWRDRPPLTEEQVGQAIQVLQQIDPEAAAYVEQIREEAPLRVAWALERRFPQIVDFLSLKQRDPAMYELRIEDLRLAHESRRLARRIGMAKEAGKDDEAERLTDQLAETLEHHFDIRQQIRERELADLEARVERLREQLEQRADNRDDLIEQRLQQLTTGEAADW